MGDTKAPPRLRSRQCMFVLYPESQQAAIDYCKQNLPCAWALHDKDVYSQASFDAYVKKHEGEPPDWMPGDLKKPHVHFVCSFPNARYFSGIAKEIGVEVNVIRKVNNLYKAYVYLWHLLDPDKYQYSKDIVGTHEFEEPSEHAGMSQIMKNVFIRIVHPLTDLRHFLYLPQRSVRLFQLAFHVASLGDVAILAEHHVIIRMHDTFKIINIFL